MDRYERNGSEDFDGGNNNQAEEAAAGGAGGGRGEDEAGAAMMAAPEAAPTKRGRNEDVESCEEDEVKRPRHHRSGEDEPKGSAWSVAEAKALSRARAVRVLAYRIRRFVTSPGEQARSAAQGAILRFFRDERNFEGFQGKEDVLWMGHEYCDEILRCCHVSGLPPQRRGRLLGRPPPAVASPRRVSSLVEALIAIARRDLNVRELLVALVDQNPELVRSLRGVAEGSSPSSSTPDGGDPGTDPATFLHVAVQRAPESMDMIRLFADPDLAMMPSPNGGVPLHWSFQLTEEAILFLIDLNPKASAVLDRSGRLPIHCYLQHERCWLVVERFVEAYPDCLSIPDPVTGVCPIVNIFEDFYFLFQGMGPLSPNPYNQTPLADKVRSLSRMIREHKPSALENATLCVPAPREEQPQLPAAAFRLDDSPLSYMCQNCPEFDLLLPLVEMCPIALAFACRVRVPLRHNTSNGGGRDDEVGDDDGASEEIWRHKGIPLDVVKKHPGVSDAAVACVDLATSELFVALLEALLATPLRNEVLQCIRVHVPYFDADWPPLSAIVESEMKDQVDELRVDVICNEPVQALLRDSPTFRNCATGLYRMNRHPDAQCFAPNAAARSLENRTCPRTKAMPNPLRVLTAIQHCAKGNVDCIYIKLRSCPPSAWP